MCLAVPMKIVECRADGTGVAELDGSRHDVDLSLVPGASVGTYVIVHAGYAIEKMNQQEADAILQLFAELSGADVGGPGAPEPAKDAG